MDINTLFNNIPDYVHYKSISQGEVEDDGSKKLNEINEYSLNNLKRFLNTPLFQQQDIDRAKKVVSEETAESQNSNETSDQGEDLLPKGPTVRLAGYDIPKSWIENRWKQECGTSYGTIDEKHRKGKVVKSNSGEADNSKGKKTYGPGLLYNPETKKPMQDSEPEGGYTVKELTRLFNLTIEQELERARKAGCKTWYQAIAYSGISGNFGENHKVTRKLRELISENASNDTIFNFIAHASDSQRESFPGLISRRMWEARQWVGDLDPQGYQSKENLAKTKELNPKNKSTKSARYGGIISRLQEGGQFVNSKIVFDKLNETEPSEKAIQKIIDWCSTNKVRKTTGAIREKLINLLGQQGKTAVDIDKDLQSIDSYLNENAGEVPSFLQKSTTHTIDPEISLRLTNPFDTNTKSIVNTLSSKQQKEALDLIDEEIAKISKQAIGRRSMPVLWQTSLKKLEDKKKIIESTPTSAFTDDRDDLQSRINYLEKSIIKSPNESVYERDRINRYKERLAKLNTTIARQNAELKESLV